MTIADITEKTCRVKDSPSKNLHKYGQAQITLQLFQFMFAFLYCLWAAVMPGKVMDPAIYGELVTSVKAEVWSWSILLVVMVYTLGILINGNWRWSPWLRLSSAFTQACIHVLFAVMAFNPSNLDPWIAGSVVLVSSNLWCVVLNIGDAARARKWNARNDDP